MTKPCSASFRKFGVRSVARAATSRSAPASTSTTFRFWSGSCSRAMEGRLAPEWSADDMWATTVDTQITQRISPYWRDAKRGETSWKEVFAGFKKNLSPERLQILVSGVCASEQCDVGQLQKTHRETARESEGLARVRLAVIGDQRSISISPVSSDNITWCGAFFFHNSKSENLPPKPVNFSINFKLKNSPKISVYLTQQIEIVNARGFLIHFARPPDSSESREAGRGANSVRAISRIHRTEYLVSDDPSTYKF